MNNEIDITLSTLKYWQEVVYDNEQHFLERFAPSSTDVVSVSWNAEQMVITTMGEETGFITEAYNVTEWLDYMLQITGTNI